MESITIIGSKQIGGILCHQAEEVQVPEVHAAEVAREVAVVRQEGGAVLRTAVHTEEAVPGLQVADVRSEAGRISRREYREQ